MIIKTILIVLLLCVIISLFVSMRNLTAKDPENQKKIVKSLTWRVALSLAIFILIIIASFFGYLQPHTL
jgi:putative copper export protein